MGPIISRLTRAHHYRYPEDLNQGDQYTDSESLELDSRFRIQQIFDVAVNERFDLCLSRFGDVRIRATKSNGFQSLVHFVKCLFAKVGNAEQFTAGCV